MSNNALYTIEQVDNKLIITVEAVKAEAVEPDKVGLDLSRYKPFPEDYTIPKNTKVIAVEDSRRFDHGAYSKGKLGVVIKNEVYEEKYVSVVFNDKPLQILMYSHELAPLDPSDHPDYKPEQPDLPETRPMNAEEIEDWVRRCFEKNLMPHNLSYFINEAIQYELNKAKR